jgi:hypothetical protein
VRETEIETVVWHPDLPDGGVDVIIVFEGHPVYEAAEPDVGFGGGVYVEDLSIVSVSYEDDDGNEYSIDKDIIEFLLPEDKWKEILWDAEEDIAKQELNHRYDY